MFVDVHWDFLVACEQAVFISFNEGPRADVKIGKETACMKIIENFIPPIRREAVTRRIGVKLLFC